ncbi:MAG: tetratricopeptide repeat protein [Streptosporangiales bacterium]|nr:tetratricopeptide repeat protein [Streptosporangiales bacterium]
MQLRLLPSALTLTGGRHPGRPSSTVNRSVDRTSSPTGPASSCPPSAPTTSTTGTSTRSAAAWTGCRWPSSSPRRGAGCSPRTKVNDGRARLTALLDGARSDGGVGDDRLLAAALTGLGGPAWRQQDNDAARKYFAESLAIMRRLGDQRGIARGLRNLALTASVTGDAVAAADLCEQGLRLLEEHGDERLEPADLSDVAPRLPCREGLRPHAGLLEGSRRQVEPRVRFGHGGATKPSW